jgi:hypothetical protein
MRGLQKSFQNPGEDPDNETNAQRIPDQHDQFTQSEVEVQKQRQCPGRCTGKTQKHETTAEQPESPDPFLCRHARQCITKAENRRPDLLLPFHQEARQRFEDIGS